MQVALLSHRLSQSLSIDKVTESDIDEVPEENEE